MRELNVREVEAVSGGVFDAKAWVLDGIGKLKAAATTLNASFAKAIGGAIGSLITSTFLGLFGGLIRK
ncbi:hypothetical protein [Andreprevotia chitinilytica]|uniref:hypothetical protein n=1 Tax=Andreprevotia chitinilytica TaxID=396808 RepID=UPI0005533BF1|nr:hypothetical protein [Andreprevotia chitinilytica]